MSDAQTLIGQVTLTAAQATVVFANLPQGYRDLRLMITGTVTSTGGNVVTYFNNDSAANYNYIQAYGDGASALAYSGAGFGGVFYSNPSVWIGDILEYSATDKHKTTLNRSGAAGNLTLMSAVRWANTSAINSISVSHTGSTYAAGTVFTLYGVLS